MIMGQNTYPYDLRWRVGVLHAGRRVHGSMGKWAGMQVSEHRIDVPSHLPSRSFTRSLTRRV